MGKKSESDEGIRMDFLSRDSLIEMSFEEKMEMIIDKVKDGSVVVLEHGFVPQEEMELIERTMQEINTKFSGIEICSFGRQGGNIVHKIVDKIFPRSPLTVIGPSKMVKDIKKDPESFSLWVE